MTKFYILGFLLFFSTDLMACPSFGKVLTFQNSNFEVTEMTVMPGSVSFTTPNDSFLRWNCDAENHIREVDQPLVGWSIECKNPDYSEIANCNPANLIPGISYNLQSGFGQKKEITFSKGNQQILVSCELQPAPAFSKIEVVFKTDSRVVGSASSVDTVERSRSTGGSADGVVNFNHTGSAPPAVAAALTCQ